MSPIRVAISDPYELVEAGSVALLSRFPDRVELLDWSDRAHADFVLFGVDDEAPAAAHDPTLHQLLRSSSAQVFAFGWKQGSPAALVASACGVHGFAHKQLAAEQLVDLIEVAHHDRGPNGAAGPPADDGCHLGILTAGLTRREGEVLALIASGLSNSEIADALYVSINSVKTYIRVAYRKIGVQRRSQAVLWATRHGLTTPAAGSYSSPASAEASALRGSA